MKRTIVWFVFLLLGSTLSSFAQAPALAVLPTPGTDLASLQAQNPSPAQWRKALQARRKLIRKLVKAYHKASSAEQVAIKAQLEQLVGESIEDSLARIKAQIASERANLSRWEEKIQQDEKNLAQLRKSRVEELLAKDAKAKHKARRKAWKKQIKAMRKQMR